MLMAASGDMFPVCRLNSRTVTCIAVREASLCFSVAAQVTRALEVALFEDLIARPG